MGSLEDFLLCHFSGAAPCSGRTGKTFWSSTFVGPPLPLASTSLQSNRVLLAQSLFLCSCWWAEGLQAGRSQFASRDRFLTNLETPTFFFFFFLPPIVPPLYLAIILLCGEQDERAEVSGNQGFIFSVCFPLNQVWSDVLLAYLSARRDTTAGDRSEVA